MQRYMLMIATVFVVVVTFCAPAGQLRSTWAAEQSACITCHEQETPGIVAQHLKGKMGQAGIDCSICHGSEHIKGVEDADKAKLPTPETCQPCHPQQYEQYASGKHALAWVAMEAMPMLTHEPSAVGGADMKGCSACHKIGLKSSGYTKTEGIHYGTGSCDSCHTRHSFSKAEAQDPRACQTCHMGFDHPQWEMWSTSKHGTIWAIEGNTGRAPVCQTCHMPEGSHKVKTAWGFLALRLPEQDAEWMANRATILQALGVLDWQGNPTPRLDVVKAGDVARLTAEEFAAERQRMVDVCYKCHAKGFVDANMRASDDIVRDSDALMADAIREVKTLYDNAYLTQPDGWAFAPDILQFYEAPTAMEQKLWTMFLEYRMRAFQGAFHANPDYMHWYGWAELKRTLAEIKEDANKLRAEPKA